MARSCLFLGYTRHSITDSGDQCIVVELGTISIINQIKLLLWDRDVRSYAYYIEVSVNNSSWERVIDHTNYMCRSWQFLYFPSRAVRYIKLVGTHNTCNKVFHVVALEAYYTTKVPTLVNGLILPTYNVATVDMSALVIEGVSRTRNALLNGDIKNYDWDSGYTCHQLGKWINSISMHSVPEPSSIKTGSGVIVIQLGQPYYIGSMRLLLWDCDSRTYSFYIETSLNQKDWEMAVDKREEQHRSWQQFTFEPRPVVFIKIVGTYNTANEVRFWTFIVESIWLTFTNALFGSFADLSLCSFRMSITRFAKATNRSASCFCYSVCIIKKSTNAITSIITMFVDFYVADATPGNEWGFGFGMRCNKYTRWIVHYQLQGFCLSNRSTLNYFINTHTNIHTKLYRSHPWGNLHQVIVK